MNHWSWDLKVMFKKDFQNIDTLLRYDRHLSKNHILGAASSYTNDDYSTISFFYKFIVSKKIYLETDFSLYTRSSSLKRLTSSDYYRSRSIGFNLGTPFYFKNFFLEINWIGLRFTKLTNIEDRAEGLKDRQKISYKLNFIGLNLGYSF